MGHSFGCIVVSAMLTSTAGQSPLVRPVNSMVLAEGALSLWSYTGSIPAFPNDPPSVGKPGFFNAIPAQSLVAGPIVTTRSKTDLAIRLWYPLATGALNTDPAFELIFGHNFFQT